MREDLTDIVCIVDKSGSMGKVKNDTIGGFNEFLDKQKEEEGDASLTLVLFDTTNKIVYNGVSIDEVEPLNEETYRPGGWTGLFDAVGVGIDATLERRESLPEEERAANVVFAILTDGEENRSQEYKGEPGRQMIFDKIDEMKNEGWEFVFLGANQEAMSNAQAIGIASNRSMRYSETGVGTRAVYAQNLSSVVGAVRQGKSLDSEDWKIYGSSEDRNK